MSKLLRPLIINNSFCGNDLNLIKFSNGKAESILISDLLQDKRKVLL